MPEETTHKRRVRYKGTHPRTFEEKYKEHDPEKYADTVAKVIEKGSTPAGILTDPSWTKGTGCNTWLRRTHPEDAGKTDRGVRDIRADR